MWLFSLQVFPFLSKSTNESQKPTIRRSVVTIACASAMVMAGVVTGLMRPAGVTPNPELSIPGGEQLPGLKLGNAADGIEAQVVVLDRSSSGLNPEFLNALREKEITKDSQKLLQLAIALKAEIDSSSDKETPPDAIFKVQEIEKLARKVKARMTVDPI